MGLVGCTWGPESAFAEGAGLIIRQQRLKGAAVVTDLSVHFVAHKGLNKLVTQMPLPSITAVEHAVGVVTVAGNGIHNWAGMAQDDPFQIREIHGEAGHRFAQLVQQLQTAPRSTVAPPSAGQHFGMSKTERIDAQWQDRSAMAGRMNPGLLSRLLTNVSGANLKKYEGERKKLHEILDDDENIEYWLGGRWGLPNDFRFDPMGGPGRNRTGHEGIAVATDRRVLLLRSGSREIELPYDRIDDVGIQRWDDHLWRQVRRQYNRTLQFLLRPREQSWRQRPSPASCRLRPATSGRAAGRRLDLQPRRLLVRLPNKVSPDGMEDTRNGRCSPSSA